MIQEHDVVITRKAFPADLGFAARRNKKSEEERRPKRLEEGEKGLSYLWENAQFKENKHRWGQHSIC